MKTAKKMTIPRHSSGWRTILVLAGCVMLWAGQAAMAGPVGTVFTYQGRLIDANKAADGEYDFQFKLYDANSDGNRLGTDVNKPEVDVIDGYFTVELDFGAVFDGNERWLDIGIRPGDLDDPNVYTLLSPRQKVSPTPYAIYAKTAQSVAGGVDWSGILNIPAGFADNVDDIGLTTEIDPTVLASVKDGVSWNEVSSIPAGFADGIDDVGLTAETDPKVSSTNTNIIPKWNGTTLVDSAVYESSGNVGIGTTSPGAKLEVAGQVKITGGSPAVGKILTCDSAGLATWQTPITGITGYGVMNYLPKFIDSYVVGNSAIYDWGGNVGIGTTSPTAKLEVAGQVKITGGSPAAGNVLTSDSSGLATWQTPISGVWITSDSNMYSGVSGNVGIGTTSPAATLDVNGTIKTAAIYEKDYIGNTWIARESNRGWYSIAMSADGTKQTAVVWAGGLIYVSTDSGNTWTPKESGRAWDQVAMSADGTIQTAVVYGGQIYISTDSGNNWTPKESNRNWQSVAMSADGMKQTAVVRGGQIYISTDSGDTWTAKESNRGWYSIAMSADGTKQTAVDNGSGSGGRIYISTDSGNTWTPKESIRGWAAVAMSADGTKQTAVDYGFGSGGQIYISTDSGDTWTAKESNRNWYSVAMSADGTKQTAVPRNGQIYVSINSGNTWIAKESNRNWWDVAMSADGMKQTAVDCGGQIYTSVSCVGVGIGTTNPAGELDVNGPIYQRGYLIHADYVFDPGYKLESIDEHSEFMWQEKHLPAMPKMQKDENGREIVEIGARSRGVVEELEKAHIYIEQLHNDINQLQEQNRKLQGRISAMEKVINEPAAGQKGGAR